MPIPDMKAIQWLNDFKDSLLIVDGHAKPLTKREKKIVEMVFSNGYQFGLAKSENQD